MKAMIIDGRKLARRQEAALSSRVLEFSRLNQRRPRLAAVKLARDPGSELYLKLKLAAAERIGVEMEVFEMSDTKDWAFSRFDGVFIQHPPRQQLHQVLKQQAGGQEDLTPEQIDLSWQQLVDRISSEKDVDCLTSANLARLRQGNPRFIPATVKAIGYCLAEAFGENPEKPDSEILHSQRLASIMKEKKITVVGRSPIVGRPLAWWLEGMGAAPCVLHSKTEKPAFEQGLLQADVVISAAGRSGLITADLVRDGVVVIDVGSPQGDVVFKEVAEKAAAITPVPGGVGPLTVVSLMENVVDAAVVQYSNHAGRESS